ncbi:MAG TPA: DNA-3-methyladenine glycosylase [Terracidiphilus sp.]|nr:DNA-3-methyladenine glycosylase [Terracidiphilus sp.]
MEKIAQIRASKTTKALPGQLISREFFENSPESVSPMLLGKLLVARTRRGSVLAGRIVEVEAYLGPHHDPPDPAAHTHRGPTPRNLVLFGPPGYAYLYSIYGKYFCANISCEREGLGAGILLRALEPVIGIAEMARNRGLDKDAPVRMIASGPSRLCIALGLTRPLHNGLDVTSAASPLQVRDDGCPAAEVVITPRIGIRHAVDSPLRFALRGHSCVSGPKRLNGTSTKPNHDSSVE